MNWWTAVHSGTRCWRALMVDERPPLTKEERRQRQKRLDRRGGRKAKEVAPRAVKVDSPPTDGGAGSRLAAGPTPWPSPKT